MIVISISRRVHMQLPYHVIIMALNSYIISELKLTLNCVINMTKRQNLPEVNRKYLHFLHKIVKGPIHVKNSCKMRRKGNKKPWLKRPWPVIYLFMIGLNYAGCQKIKQDQGTDKKRTVKPVQHAAMSGDKRGGIFDSCIPFEE